MNLPEHRRAPLYTGTMGWSYEDWKGVFYARDVKADRMLEQYAPLFPPGTVELDSTFYGVPRPTTLQQWSAHTPDTFRFSAKAPRAITHERRLIGAVESATDFGELFRQELGPKLGALLLQLPPDFTSDERRFLAEFAEGIASTRRAASLPWVVEFRHASWEKSDIAPWLEARGIITATTERVDLGAPLRYLRLLGIENSVQRFDERQFDRSAEIASWAKRLDEARVADPDTPIFCYVRNFFEGHAPATILALRERLGLPSLTPPGQQQMSLF